MAVDSIHAALDALESRPRLGGAPAVPQPQPQQPPVASTPRSAMHAFKLRAQAANSLLCVGLDPHEADIGSGTADEARDFCVRLIRQTSEFAACFKPNSAFFERLGADGFRALNEVIAAVPNGIPVLLDAKRGDIGSTAAAYADAAFNCSNAAAVTVSPYLGHDGVQPFTKDASKGIFLLCRTSNPGSADFQELALADGRALYEAVATRAAEWNINDNIGLVVGATHPEVMAHVRSLVPEMWILAPGIGAQGGDLEKTVHAGVRQDGFGLLVNVSRGISRAENPKSAAAQYRDDINTARESAPRDQESGSLEATSLKEYQTKFIQLALQHQVLRFGDFTLKSGRKSPYFFNAGNFKTGGALAKVGEFYASTIKNSGIEFDVLFGPAYKGIPLAATTSIAMYNLFGEDVPYTFNRKEAKDHGEGGSLVGASVEGKRVLILDDVITAGTAIRETMTILEAAKATAVGVVIALDRQEQTGGDAAVRMSAIQGVAQEFGIPVACVVKLDDLIVYLSNQSDSNEELTKVSEYRATFGV